MENKVLEWTSYHRAVTEREEDWFWSLGILAGFASLISLIVGNILLAVIIGLTGFILFTHEKRPIDSTLNVRIDKRGVQLNNELFTYEKIASFWVEDAVEEKPARLILHYRRIFVPNIIIPIIGHSPEEVRELMLQYGEEERHVESFTETVFETFGF